MTVAGILADAHCKTDTAPALGPQVPVVHFAPLASSLELQLVLHTQPEPTQIAKTGYQVHLE